MTPTPARTTPSCWCRSAARRSPRTSCRSWRTSPAAAASRASGSRRSGSTTSASAAARRSTTRTARFLAALREDLAGAGIDLPVYWGNRNWDPYLTDTVRQMAADGVTRAACFVTSAYSSYSSCRQYRENLFDAVAAEVRRARRVLDKLRLYFNHPGFVEPVVDATLAALADLPDDVRDGAHLAFVTHSIPDAMNDGSGPERRRVRRAAPQRDGRGRRAGPRRRPAAGTRTSWSSARGPGRRRSRGSSPTSTTTSRQLHAAGRARPW